MDDFLAGLGAAEELCRESAGGLIHLSPPPPLPLPTWNVIIPPVVSCTQQRLPGGDGWAVIASSRGALLLASPGAAQLGRGKVSTPTF